ncbi:MAG TPA: hypothetical protein VFI02_22030 [Armatimonadota bacterium]|nr:hypothetical protein [Armatimonadota bacterium]
MSNGSQVVLRGAMSAEDAGKILDATNRVIGRMAPAIGPKGIAGNRNDHITGLQLEQRGIPARIALAVEMNDEGTISALVDRREALPGIIAAVRLGKLAPQECPIEDSQADRVETLERELARLPELLNDAKRIGPTKRVQELEARQQILPGIIERAKAPGDDWRCTMPLFLYSREGLIKALESELVRVSQLLRRPQDHGRCIGLAERQRWLPDMIREVRVSKLWFTYRVEY